MSPGDPPDETRGSAPRGVDRLASWGIALGVAFYRGTLGMWLGGHCRFQPSCSQYMLDAVAKHGPWRGGWRGIKRVCRCRPGGGFGDDPA